MQSHLIFRRIRALSEEHGKPVFVFVEDVGASGGYMIAAAGDEIVVDPSSIVGSIGVVAATFGFDKAIEKLGIDREAVIAASKDPSVDAEISENYKIAEALGLRGTPSFVVGDEVIPGAISFEALQEKITKARESACRTC